MYNYHYKNSIKKIFLTLVIFVSLCLIHLIIRTEPTALVGDTPTPTEKSVDMIMNLYGCHDMKIRNAILHTFDPVLVACVIAKESEFRPNALSKVGCRGLMQLSPDKLDDWRDVEKNITVGSEFLRYLVYRYDGNIKLALAGYNAGPGNVATYGGVPPFRETIWYIRHITSRYIKYRV